MKTPTLKKISTIKRKGLERDSVAAQLQKHGFTRMPGSIVRMQPFKEIDGSYRIGIDPNALYIKRIANDVEREQEIARVTAYRDKLSEMLPTTDLSSRSIFYTGMFDSQMGESTRCPVAKLIDGDNLFNLDDPWALIVYAYLRVHPEIAPSMREVDAGFYTKAKYYVNDEEVEDEIAYKLKRDINTAIGLLDSMSLDKRKRIGRQLGEAFTDNTSEATAYARLDSFIKASEELKTKHNASKFIEFARIADENLAIQDTVTQALMYGVLRKNKSGELFRGKAFFAKDEKDAAVFLSSAENQADYDSVLEELRIKKVSKN